MADSDFNEASIELVRAELKHLDESYVVNELPDNSDEYLSFMFIGQFEEKEVLFDAVMYTLQLHHESEQYYTAEQMAMEKFPEFRKYVEDGDDEKDGLISPDVDEEVSLFITEAMMELEEEEAVKVSEHLETDEELDWRIGLNICLHVEMITPEVVEKFVKDYKSGSLKLDPTLYSFVMEMPDDDQESISQ